MDALAMELDKPADEVCTLHVYISGGGAKRYIERRR